MRIQQIFLIFIFLLPDLSCKNKYEIIKDDLPEGSIKLKYQVQNQVTDNLSLEITDINDSRCPVGAICTVAGSVKVDIRVLSAQGTETATLYFSAIQNTVQNVDTVMSYRIEVVDVTPIPFLDKPIESDSLYSVYVLTKQI
jgi:hypothetical protein